MFEGMIVIGENLNATRKIKADGKMVVEREGGRKAYPYRSADGQERFLDLTQALSGEDVQKSGKVKHIAIGIMARDEEFIAAMAQSQARAGADYLDCCVDEISPWPAERIEHMKWLVRTVQKHSRLQVSLDSSDSAVLRGGLEALDPAFGRPLINSINLEEARLKIIPLAAEMKAQVVVNACGPSSLPTAVEERIENLTRMMRILDEAGLPPEDRWLDPLVLPVATDPNNGLQFLEACRRAREAFGGTVHLTGGFSNVSFGLPGRRLLNEAMTWLAREAGCDTAFIDPLQTKNFRPGDEDFELAVAALKGEDPYCVNFMTYCRAHG